MSALQCAARERSGGRCECDGLCSRQHTGRCLNVEGRCAVNSRYYVRLRLVDGRELCPGCARSSSNRSQADLSLRQVQGRAEMRSHERTTANRDGSGHHRQPNPRALRARLPGRSRSQDTDGLSAALRHFATAVWPSGRDDTRAADLCRVPQRGEARPIRAGAPAGGSVGGVHDRRARPEAPCRVSQHAYPSAFWRSVFIQGMRQYDVAPLLLERYP